MIIGYGYYLNSTTIRNMRSDTILQLCVGGYEVLDGNFINGLGFKYCTIRQGCFIYTPCHMGYRGQARHILFPLNVYIYIK